MLQRQCRKKQNIAHGSMGHAIIAFALYTACGAGTAAHLLECAGRARLECLAPRAAGLAYNLHSHGRYSCKFICLPPMFVLHGESLMKYTGM